MQKRDFTINAIYVNVENGKTFSHELSFSDLENRILRVCSEDSIKRDPVRFMRAFRFIAQYNLSVEERTKNSLKRSIELYLTSKQERARNELKQLLQNDIDMIETSIGSVFPDFIIFDKFSLKIAENYKVFSTKISKDMDYLSLLKAFLIYKQFKEFVYGLTDREMSIIKYLEEGINEHFDEFFEQYYSKRNKRVEFMLNIVANVASNEIEKFLEITEQFNAVKLKEEEVNDFAKPQRLKIEEAYKYYLKEKLKPIYENIYNS
jgi:tRNA nucleotidyltransferase/poly(A) polymerase